MDNLVKVAVCFFGSMVILMLLIVMGVGLYNIGKIDASESAKIKEYTDFSQKNNFKPTVNIKSQEPAVSRKGQAVYDRSSNYKKREVYTKLMDTCNKWTRWFNSDRNETSRLNMNVACRDASNYARNQLKIMTDSPNYVSDYTTAKTNKNSVSVNVVDNSNYCSVWAKKLESIQDQLRAGYSEPKGNLLRGQRRELTDLIYRNG